MGGWALLASQPLVWEAALIGGKMMNYMPIGMLPVPPLRAWTRTRTLPEWRGGKFRSWLKHRKKRV
jgi:L-lactate dehydrogenase complex protein LldF